MQEAQLLLEPLQRFEPHPLGVARRHLLAHGDACEHSSRNVSVTLDSTRKVEGRSRDAPLVEPRPAPC